MRLARCCSASDLLSRLQAVFWWYPGIQLSDIRRAFPVGKARQDFLEHVIRHGTPWLLEAAVGKKTYLHGWVIWREQLKRKGISPASFRLFDLYWGALAWSSVSPLAPLIEPRKELLELKGVERVVFRSLLRRALVFEALVRETGEDPTRLRWAVHELKRAGILSQHGPYLAIKGASEIEAFLLARSGHVRKAEGFAKRSGVKDRHAS